MKKILFILSISILFSCKSEKDPIITPDFSYLKFSENILDYRVSPKDSIDKSGLMFSDQGAWFAYSLPGSSENISGFNGPFLMTQQNGRWSSQMLSKLNIRGENNAKIFDWKSSLISQKSYSSHLEQDFKNDSLSINQTLVYLSGHTALQKTTITNTSEKGITIHPSMNGLLYDNSITVSSENQTIVLTSDNYPEDYEIGKEIRNLEKADDCLIFHSGTKKSGNKLLTNGGRVITITSLADTKEEALKKSIKNANTIDFEGKYFRKDIGFDV